MAIYTSYGRYLKAKYFKDLLESNNSSIYMLLGIGLPDWDLVQEDSATAAINTNIPLAPYNTSIMSENADQNPFHDTSAIQVFTSTHNGTSVVDTTMGSGEVYGAYTCNTKNIQPPFPCIWPVQHDTILFMCDNEEVTTSNFYNYYISDDGGTKNIHSLTGSSAYSSIELPTGDTYEDSIKRQYYAEMYLRGKAMTERHIFAPVGLLGAVKCDISFVKDIGDNYTGDPKQLWYGDRYWELVEPQSDISEYLNSNTSEYPHHLLFNALITPRRLCSDLTIDRNIVPRQLGIFTCPSSQVASGAEYLRADEYLFNFGQYAHIPSNNSNLYEVYTRDYDRQNNIGSDISSNPHIIVESSNEDAPAGIIDLTVECSIASSNGLTAYKYNGSGLNFMLNDYIRGAVRNNHSADRFGYIVGF